MKPITYYLSDTEDRETVEELTAKYGGYLEKLDRRQKHALLMQITEEIWHRPGTERALTPAYLSESLETFSNDTLLGLAIATANYLREKSDD